MMMTYYYQGHRSLKNSERYFPDLNVNQPHLLFLCKRKKILQVIFYAKTFFLCVLVVKLSVCVGAQACNAERFPVGKNNNHNSILVFCLLLTDINILYETESVILTC